MYSRESNPYGQQAYSSQSSYAQSLGPGYPGSSAGATEGSTQPSRGSRHSLMLGAPQEADTSAYRAHNHHLSTGPHYGGQYSSVYGSVPQQIPPIGGKGSVPSALESHTGFGSDSPKFTTRDYVTSSNHGFGHKGEHLYSDPVPDYSTLDRRKYGEQYGEQRSAHVGRDLPSEQASRYPDSTSFGHKHQVELYERLDQASMIRQEQVLKSQGLQSASLEGGPRQAEYLAARSAAVRHTPQDPISYGGRIDSDHRSLSALAGSLYTGQHAPSILGAAPQRSVDDVMYAHSSTNPGYGVSLPPGRDYGIGKGLHATPVESDYPSTRAGHSRLDDYKDDRAVYSRELERREKDQDYLREREKERDRVKERDRMKERERQRERDRERDREREREKERERQRQRERDRERALERREKERDHERKRGAEIKHEQTPPRISRDRRGPSLTKDSKSLRRESPRPEALHRRHSPVKRREYFCKVYSSSLAEVERDYLSLDRRYPRLFISPECSKVLVNWPKGNLKLSLHTPVSFEHDFVEEGAVTAQEQLSSKRSAGELEKSEHRMTIWNAKILLMSGLSKSALEELSSDRNYDDRIPHMCNMLRFAVLKQDNSLMAIGGQWDSVDGEDPSLDDSLIQTVLRHAKDLAHLDLKNCQHWNRFLEIHYERVGKDGLFSHKEVTVYFVPDLSECLPSLESWREQWLTKKKAIAERERQQALRKEKSGDKESQKDKEAERLTDAKRGPKSEKSFTSGQSLEGSKKENDGKLKENTADSKGSKNKNLASKGLETCAEGNNSANKDPGESAAVETDGSAKLVKKRVIKRIVKQKATNNKDDLETPKMNDMVDESKTGDGKSSIEIASPQDESSAKPPVKTFIRKKIVKKVLVGQTPKEKAELNPLDVKTVKAAEASEDTGKDKTDSSSTSVVQGAVVKKTIKRKIIKRVPKRKTVLADANNVAGNVDSNKDDTKEEKSVQAEIEGQVVAEPNVDSVENVNMINPEQKVSPKTESKIATKQEIKEEKRTEEVNIAGTKTESGVAKDKDSQNDDRPKLKVKEQSKEETQKKGQDGKILSKSKSTREVKEKRNEDPPRHPGLFLQTKGSKDTKLRSLSLSLDSLLDYSDKDIEDSTFELSLLAESLYEMLYYEMGCRLMNFLQKLRIKFVIKRSQQKRQREESSKKESAEKSMKRAKTDEPMDDANSTKTESHGKQDDEKPLVKEEATPLNIAKEATSLNNAEEATIQDEAANDESEMDEDPEEEDLEMPDSSVQQGLTKEENAEVKLTDADSKSEKVAGSGKDEGQATAIEAYKVKPNLKSGSKEEESTKVEKNTGATRGEVNKELLQAFRFFDRNRAGFIRVEDMRLIIHNLGKYLSHREVKELVQSALLESNTGRDDRILYNKLISMTNV